MKVNVNMLKSVSETERNEMNTRVRAFLDLQHVKLSWTNAFAPLHMLDRNLEWLARGFLREVSVMG